MNRHVLYATFLLCLAFTAHAQSASEALHHAGELRTLSQRIPKLYFQQLLGLNTTQSQGSLAAAAASFETRLNALRSVAATGALDRRYRRTLTLWAQAREIIDAPPTRDGAATLHYLADDLMIATGQIAFRLEHQSATSDGRLVDLSMRQAMLAQRLAKLYLARRLLGDSGANRVDVVQAEREFETALKEIAATPTNSQQTQDALELAVGQWIFFRRAVAAGDRGDDRLALHVVTTSERITESMDDVVRSLTATRPIAGQQQQAAVAR